MRKIRYPDKGSTDYNVLLNDYMALFPDIVTMQTAWNNWKIANGADQVITETVNEILVADSNLIANLYFRFIGLGIAKIIVNPTTGKNERSPEYKELDRIFHYTKGYDNDIAKFFEDRAEQLHIVSCHYCEMAYVNVYTHNGTNTRHFDIDHYLPKSECPIIGLSLFNFVPSCQVCNSRIKLHFTIGTTEADWKKFNPASETYDFDNNVRIRLRMKRIPTVKFTNKDDYYIHFRCKNGFRIPVDFFHLEERYDFHKIEAIRLLRLKAQYPISAIRKIAGMLGKTTSEVREDIFHRKYLKDNDRCFEKLTRDILA